MIPKKWRPFVKVINARRIRTYALLSFAASFLLIPPCLIPMQPNSSLDPNFWILRQLHLPLSLNLLPTRKTLVHRSNAAKRKPLGTARQKAVLHNNSNSSNNNFRKEAQLIKSRLPRLERHSKEKRRLQCVHRPNNRASRSRSSSNKNKSRNRRRHHFSTNLSSLSRSNNPSSRCIASDLKTPMRESYDSRMVMSVTLNG